MASRCQGKSEPVDEALYAKVKAEAKRKFPTYPSIYANSWLVREYKARGGRYRCTSKHQTGGLKRWYREKWVDLSRPLPDGGWEPCGRPEVDSSEWREKYPKCRPLAEAKKLSKKQIQSAVRRKRAAVRKQRRGKPTYVSTLVKNPATKDLLSFGVVGAAIGILLWFAANRSQPQGQP